MIGEKLRLLRTEKNITQKQIAKLLNITQPSYSMYESNKRTPDYKTLQKLADILNVNVTDILGSSDMSTSKNHPKNDDLYFHKAKDYNSLDDEGKRMVDDFIDFVKLKHRKK